MEASWNGQYLLAGDDDDAVLAVTEEDGAGDRADQQTTSLEACDVHRAKSAAKGY
jgi:hypothetical protein